MSDNDLIDEALTWFANSRHKYAQAISRPGAQLNGRRVSQREIDLARAQSKAVDDLIYRRKQARLTPE